MSSFQEATLHAMEKCLQELQHALEGLTPAEARWQPTLDTNHIAWLVWHMARAEDLWGSRLQESPQVWNSEGWADRFHMDPASTGVGHTMDEVRAMPDISLTDLMAYFHAARAVTRRYLINATDTDLAREAPTKNLGPVTHAWIVGHMLVEVSLHVGQVQFIRGMMRGRGWRELPGG